MNFPIDEHGSGAPVNLAALIVTLAILGCGQSIVARAESAGTQFEAERPTVLITGSNRGIGLGFARYYAVEGWNVIATCRKPKVANELQNLAREHSQLVIEQLDVTDHARIEALAEQYSQVPIDLLINNAAVLGDLEEQQYGSLDFDLFEWVMAVNVYGPMKNGRGVHRGMLQPATRKKLSPLPVG